MSFASPERNPSHKAFLDNIADKLRSSKTGIETFALTATETQKLMDGVTADLLASSEAKNEKVDAEVKNTVSLFQKTEATIIGAITAKIKIRSPIPGDIEVICAFQNDESKPGSIRLSSPVKTSVSFLLNAALLAKGIDLNAQANTLLADPTIALSNILKKELNERNLKLTGVKLEFAKKDGIFCLRSTLRVQKIT